MTDAPSRPPFDPVENNESAIALPRKTVAKFVKALLLEQQPHITQPDGRHLYGYRVQGDRYEVLRARVRFEFHALLHSPVDEHLAAGFVLYAAETWRRSEDLRRWNKWDVVLETLDRSETQCPDLYEAVETGLRWWKRPLVRLGDTTRYLATLVCEGGLPLHLVREKGTPFRRYFRQLLAHVRDFGLEQRPLRLVAEREASTLPKSLQQEPVYALAAALVEQLWAIHRQVKDRVGDPIQLLDNQDPSWRDRMPLRLDDAVARGLLRELIDDVRDVVANRGSVPRVQRWLQLQDDAWVLRARIELPRSTTVERFAGLLDGDPDGVPRTFRVAVTTEASVHPGFGSGYAHGNAIQFEVANTRRAEVEGVEAAGQIELTIDAADARWGTARSVAIHGGQRLSAQQPWVFRTVDEEVGRASFVADGGCRTRFDEVWVALPEGVSATPQEDSTWEVLGRNVTTGRTIHRCRGAVQFQNGDEDEWRVLTSQEEGRQYECFLSGERFRFDTAAAVESFVGMPRVLQREESGIASTPPLQEIVWRPAGRHSPWQRNLGAARGCILLRARIDSETRLNRSIAVLPMSFDCRIAPVDARQGRIHLRGLEGATVLPATAPNVVVEQQAVRGVEDAIDLVCSANGETPATIRVRLEWPHATPIDLVLPAPFRSAHFVTADGVKCKRDYVALDDLFAMRAVVVSPHQYEEFALVGTLRDRKGVAGVSLSDANRKIHVELVLRRGDAGHHVAELRHLVDPVRRAMRAVPELDLQVELRLEARRGSTLPVTKLNVQRYAGTLHCEWEQGWLSLATTSDPLRALPGEIGVRAFPLWRPADRDTTLERLPTPEPTWLFDPATREPGPWLLHGHFQERPCTRPRLWLVDRDSAPTAGNAHQRAVLAPPDGQDAARAQMFTDLRTGVDEGAWTDLLALIERSADLPASSFDTVRKLLGDPTTLILCLLRAPTSQCFDAVFALRDELPFEWAQLPASAWIDAWRAMRDHTGRRYDGAGLEATDVAEILKEKSERVTALLPKSERSLLLLCNWVRSVCEPDLPTPPEVSGARDKRVRQTLLEQVGDQWMQLRRRHTNDQWPRMHGIDTWNDFAQGDLDRLGEEHDEVLPFHRSIARAPLVAACLAVTERPAEALLTLELHRARDFDAEWFDFAHERYLAIALATLPTP